jgi:YgiT-type zinc finger domain-containing protein
MGRRLKDKKGSLIMCCFMCKGSLEDKLTTFMVDVGNCIVIVKNVPSQVCSQCGETSYGDNVAAELEKIVGEARKDLTEIMVINYVSRAA